MIDLGFENSLSLSQNIDHLNFINILQESGSDAAFIADRAELLLRQAARFHLKTRAQVLQYLGSHFRGALDALPRKSDYQVCPWDIKLSSLSLPKKPGI